MGRDWGRVGRVREIEFQEAQKAKLTDWKSALMASPFIPLVNRRVHLAGVRAAGQEAGRVSSLISRGLQYISLCIKRD